MTIFIVGISTDVGKSIASAIVVEALQADYWKPIQAGDLHYSDTQRVKDLISNKKSVFFENSYALKTPASPHFSAELEQTEIKLENITRPKTENILVIEPAGGVYVPINQHNTMIDLIRNEDKIILVSKNYLGSINHTMLTIKALENNNLKVSGIIFNGEENPSTENWIQNFTKIPIIGRINWEDDLNPKIIKNYAENFKENLLKIIQ